MARRIVMMKQHGRQQGSSFLPHGSKKVSVQYLLVRNVNIGSDLLNMLSIVSIL